MYLVQLLLPLSDNQGHRFASRDFAQVRDELTQEFGGVTAYLRSPAVGLWKEKADRVSRDDVVMFEVMLDQLDRDWWANYRQTLRSRFRQDEVLIRATQVERL